MLVILLLIVFVGLFALAGIMGAPYVPILKRDSTTLLDLAQLKPGQTIIDLGSGDGRLLRAAAARGVIGIGYEINPVMYAISLIVCWRYRKQISIHLADLWHTKLPESNVIYVFLMPKFMAKLSKKFEDELHHKTTIVSYAFELPDRKPVRHNKNTFVYEIGD
jgi:hypothetical protein